MVDLVIDSPALVDLPVAIPAVHALSAIRVDYGPDSWSLVDHCGEIVTFETPGAERPVTSAAVNWICFYREAANGPEVVALRDMNLFTPGDLDYWPFGEPKREQQPTASPFGGWSKHTMPTNTRPTLPDDSPWRPSGATYTKPDEAIHTVRCTVLKRFHYQGYARWEFHTELGGQPATLFPDDPEMAAALVRYPLLEMDPQERRTVDLTIRYQWQPGAGARAGRRKLIEICEQENDMGKEAVKERIEQDHADHVSNREETDFDNFDKPGPTHAAWVDSDKERGKFFADYTDLCNKYVVDNPDREKIRKGTLTRVCGYDSLKGYEGTAADLLKDLEFDIKEAGYKPLNQTTGKAESKDPAPGSQNGQSEPSRSRSTDMPEPTKIEWSSEAKPGNVELAEKKAEIRTKYNKPQRGNDYLVVQGRVLLFRVEHPDWSIETDVIAITDLTAVFKATIKNADGRVIASGHGRATEAGTKNLGGRFVEKAETAAIGRALALAGYGTDDTLDDADYLADSPVEKMAS